MSLPTASTANFQSVLNASLDSYVKETGVDITKHPSADKLQDCHSPEDVIQLLLEREAVFKDNQDTKIGALIDRLRPAVRVVHALTNVLGDAASLVSSKALGCRGLIIYASLILGIPAVESDICRNRYSPLSTYCPSIVSDFQMTFIHTRQLLGSTQAMTHFSTSLNASRVSLIVFISIPTRSRCLP
jgi:hypothetical protein